MVSKRSVKMTYDDYKSLLQGDKKFFGRGKVFGYGGRGAVRFGQIGKNFPAAVVDYVREAYICPAGNVRITFDSRLKTMTGMDALNGQPNFYSVLENGEIILEVKYDSFMPSYIRNLLAGLP